MSSLFLSLQGSYKQLQMVLLKELNSLDSLFEETSKASAMLIPHLNTILKKNGKSLTDLDFIAVDQGPGAFTSLRVMIATVNALGFATKIPLLGVDGLDALAMETKNSQTSDALPVYYCMLLNAFNQEVFFGVYDQDLKLVMPKSYKNIDLFLSDLVNFTADLTVVFSGNGARLFEEKINAQFGTRALMVPLEVASAQAIGLCAFELWNQNKHLPDFKKSCQKLSPLYMKLQTFTVKT